MHLVGPLIVQWPYPDMVFLVTNSSLKYHRSPKLSHEEHNSSRTCVVQSLWCVFIMETDWALTIKSVSKRGGIAHLETTLPSNQLSVDTLFKQHEGHNRVFYIPGSLFYCSRDSRDILSSRQHRW